MTSQIIGMLMVFTGGAIFGFNVAYIERKYIQSEMDGVSVSWVCTWIGAVLAFIGVVIAH